MNKHNDDLDLPDMPVEPDAPPPVKVSMFEEPTAPVVVKKTYDRNAWIREFGPRPPSAGVRVLNYVIAALFFGTALVIVQALAWSIFS